MILVRMFTVVGVVMILAVPLAAQVATTTTESKISADNSIGNKSSEKKPVNAARRDIQSDVRLLLVSLASDAATFRDQSLRARCLARIADVLWTVDIDQGKRLFRNAWEAAQIADQSDTPFTLGQSPPNLRHEVLKLAAKRDRLLAEEFLKKLQVEEPARADHSGNSVNGSEDVLKQRLLLANELLRDGDTKRALEFANPVLGSVNIAVIEFLTNVRTKDAVAADSFYMALLTGPRVGMDASTISLLSSYLFAPHIYVTFNNEGAADRIWLAAASSQPVDVQPRVRLAFFQAATEVLLRAQLRYEQEQRASGVLSDYMTLRHLMPLFEAYAPAELTQTIRGELETLSSLASLTVREEQTESIQQRGETENASADQQQTLLEQIDRARTSVERDELYFRLALLSLNKDDIQARDYVGKIDGSSFRKQAQTWIDNNLAINAVKKKRLDVALQLARVGALSPIQKVWIFTQAAKLLAKSDREKALLLINDAITEARRIESAEIDRPRGLFAIAHAVQLLEPDRAREPIFDAVRAANSTETFTGEGGVLTLSVKSKNQILSKTVAVSEFDIAGIFEEMASSDYESAVQLARGFQADAPRANATIAISRSILLDQKQSGKTPKDQE